MLCYAMLCYAMLCFTILYCTALFYTILCYTIIPFYYSYIISRLRYSGCSGLWLAARFGLTWHVYYRCPNNIGGSFIILVYHIGGSFTTPASVKKSLLFLEPWPRSPAAETALQPQICMLWKLILPPVFFSGGVFFRGHQYQFQYQ